jgi:ABC-2 type transporter
VTMLAIGYTLAAVYPSVAAANGISNGLLIILIMSSGAFFPTEGLSAGVRTAMACSPVHHITELVRAAWSGTSLPMVSVLVLIGFTVVFGLLSTVLFRWDKTA